MNFLPISLKVKNKIIVVIGGGKVATQKLRVLVHSSATIRVYAKKICAEIMDMPCECKTMSYTPALIEGAFLVYACTDDCDMNKQIASDARRLGVLVNVADDPCECEFISPAIWFNDNMSVSVSSDSTDARRSVLWRNAIREWGESDTTLR